MEELDTHEKEVACYLLPEEAQLRLQQLRDHLHFLAALSQPRSTHEDTQTTPPVSMAALSCCFSSLATQLDAALSACWWSGFSHRPPQPPA